VLNNEANILNAQSNLVNSKANLVKADVAVLDAKRTLDRNLPLVEKKVIAQVTMDTAQTIYDTAVAQKDVAKAQVESAMSQVESSKAQVEQAKAALKMAETNLRYTTIRSPVNGTVISRNVDVDTNVSEADVGRITVGQDSTFTVDAYPGRIFRGKVSEVRNAPIIIQNVVTYDVVILVDNKDLKLKPGMTANVSVMIAHREGVLKIPNAALRFRPAFAKTESGKVSPPQKVGDQVKSSQEDQGRPGRIWILSKEGKETPVSIVLGITDGTFSEVMSGDLREGGEVIVEETSNKKGPAQSSGSPPFMGAPRR
jgi:HlyD family secretion protein